MVEKAVLVEVSEIKHGNSDLAEEDQFFDDKTLVQNDLCESDYGWSND